MEFTLINCTRTTEIQPVDYSWPDLISYFSTFLTCTPEGRDNHALFTGWKMKPPEEAEFTEHANGFRHYSRSKKNCVSLSFLTLDIDNQPKKGLPYWSLEAAIRDLTGIEAVFYTSYNHQNPEKDQGVDKFRVVLPLHAPLPLAEYEDLVLAFRAEFPSAASESFTPSQPFYPPLQQWSRRESSRAHHSQGAFLDWTLFPKLTIQAAVKTNANLKHSSVSSGETETLIQSTKQGTKTALEWFNSLQEGYEHRVPCFSCERVEKNPTAFFFREGMSLKHYDKGTEQWLNIRCASPLTELKLVRKQNKTPEENLQIPSVKPVEDTFVWHEPEEDAFIPPLTEAERRAALSHIPSQLVDVNVLTAPEGYGKSYLVKILADLGFKVLFCCASNEQADQKAEEFSEWSGVQVRRPISKSHNLFMETGVKQINTDREFEVGLPQINKIRTAQAAGVEAFKRFYTEHKSEFLQNWHEADILCTTFVFGSNALARGILGHCMKRVVVVIDDPGSVDFFNRLYVTPDQLKNLNDGKIKLPKGCELTDYKGHEIIELDQTSFPFCTVLPYHWQGRKTLPKLLFTTTELLTEAVICAKFKDVKVFDLMHNIDAGNICLLGTNLVRYKSKPFLIGMTDAISKRTKIQQQGPFGNGLKDYRTEEENLNHINLKGRNDFSEGPIVVVLNHVHPNQGASLFVNIDIGINGKHLGMITVLDQFHQSMRNAGYRFRGHDTIVLCDPMLWDFLAENSRYRLSQHSCHFADHPSTERGFLHFRRQLQVEQKLSTEPSVLMQKWKFFLACWSELIDEDLQLKAELTSCPGCGTVVEETRKSVGAKWETILDYFPQDGTRRMKEVRTRKIILDPIEKKEHQKAQNRERQRKFLAKKRKKADF